MSDSLCQVCLGCLCRHERRLEVDDKSILFFIHHLQIGSLQDSASANCRICSLLWTQFAPLQHRIKKFPDADTPLSYLLLQPSTSLKVERSYELGAYLNDDITEIDGIEQTTINLFLLQGVEGKPDPALFIS